MFQIENNKEYADFVKAYADNNWEVVDKIDGQVSANQFGFDEGDRIEWPSELKFLKSTFAGATRPTYAVICKVTDKEGNSRMQLFYPVSLGKRVNVLKKASDGKYINENDYQRPDGQAALDYQSKANLAINDVFREMVKNHPNGLVVSKWKPVETYAFRSENVIGTRLYTFDYAE